MEKLEAPVYKAKKIDSEEYVTGYLRKCVEYHLYTEDDKYLFRIDPSTLSISFDNKNFYSFSLITRAIEDHLEGVQKCQA